jgi:hypothetical protein
LTTGESWVIDVVNTVGFTGSSTTGAWASGELWRGLDAGHAKPRAEGGDRNEDDAEPDVAGESLGASTELLGGEGVVSEPLLLALADAGDVEVTDVVVTRAYGREPTQTREGFIRQLSTLNIWN